MRHHGNLADEFKETSLKKTGSFNLRAIEAKSFIISEIARQLLSSKSFSLKRRC